MSLHDGFAPLSGMDNSGRIRLCFIKAALSSGGVIQRQPTAPAALRAPDSARCTPAVVIAARPGRSAALDGGRIGDRWVPKTVPWTTPRPLDSARPRAPQHLPTASDWARCRACWPRCPEEMQIAFFLFNPVPYPIMSASEACPFAQRDAR